MAAHSSTIKGRLECEYTLENGKGQILLNLGEIDETDAAKYSKLNNCSVVNNDGKKVLTSSLPIHGITIEDAQLRQEVITRLLSVRNLHPNIVCLEPHDEKRNTVFIEKISSTLAEALVPAKIADFWEFIPCTQKYRMSPHCQRTIRAVLSVCGLLAKLGIYTRISAQSVVYTKVSDKAVPIPKIWDLSDYERNSTLDKMLSDIASLIDKICDDVGLKKQQIYDEVKHLISNLQKRGQDPAKLELHPALTPTGKNLSFICSVYDSIKDRKLSSLTRQKILGDYKNMFGSWQKVAKKYKHLEEMFIYADKEEKYPYTENVYGLLRLTRNARHHMYDTAIRVMNRESKLPVAERGGLYSPLVGKTGMRYTILEIEAVFTKLFPSLATYLHELIPLAELRMLPSSS